jgi:hypothetical protein
MYSFLMYFFYIIGGLCILLYVGSAYVRQNNSYNWDKAKVWYVYIAILLGGAGCWAEVRVDDSPRYSKENLDKTAQVFNPAQAQYCKDPWFRGNTQELFNLVTEKDKYGQSTNIVNGWVKLRMKLAIPQSRGFSKLKISFYYYSPNCWGSENREGNIYYEGKKETLNDILQEMADANSDLGAEFLTNAKDGEIFDVYIENPSFEKTSPQDACDKTYATIKANGNTMFFRAK